MIFRPNPIQTWRKKIETSFRGLEWKFFKESRVYLVGVAGSPASEGKLICANAASSESSELARELFGAAGLTISLSELAGPRRGISGNEKLGL